MFRVVCILFLVVAFFIVPRESAYSEQPVEIGIVDWSRDYDASLKRSAQENKPVFLLFQEVPGCSGCKEFGQTVLSNKSMVRAIQEEFIPVVVFNNHPGRDAEILKKFKEPSWNYQVIRFLNSNEQDIIPRKDRVWDVQSLKKRMIEVLTKTKRKVPAYLNEI